jgi:tetratricopeptide (TPR) repeat protein
MFDRTGKWLLVLVLVACFGMAARLDIWYSNWQGTRSGSTDILNVLIGDSRRMFANHFFKKADAYFHSGYYTSIFDDAKNEESHMTKSVRATGNTGHADDDEDCGIPHSLGKSKDWIESLGRYFIPNEHMHLEGQGTEREILPWLQLSAFMDPHRIETFTTTAYWLRGRLGKVNEAEQLLREGLRNNPKNPDILFELGRIFEENRHDLVRAKNLYDLAYSQYKKLYDRNPEADTLLLAQIIIHLERVDEQAGNIPQAIEYLKELSTISPAKDKIQLQIKELEEKIKPTPNTTPH